jgi:signal peptidase I
MRPRQPKAPLWLLPAGLVAALWLFFSPPQLGGSTIFTATVGNSMEPMFHKGDLAVTRRASSYRVGDVTLYMSPVLHRPVLHRIVAIQDGRYFFKGDHNDFVDPGSVTRADLLGKLWFHVPRAGKALSWLGKPGHASLLAAIAALVLVLGGATKGTRRRRGRGRRRGSGWKAPAVRSGMGGFHRPRRTPENIFAGIAGVVALVLLAAGFTTSTKRSVPVAGAYQHGGTFSYVARLAKPDSAYPSGVVHTGQPLFLHDARTLDVAFAYRFASRLPHGLRGTASLKALISADSNWHDLYVLEPPTAFGGDRTTLHGTIDLDKLRALITQLSVDSGAVGAEYTVDIEPIVHVRGVVGGKPIAETFSPVLPLTVTQTLLKLDVVDQPPPPGATYAAPQAGSAIETALNPTQPGSVPGVAPSYVSLARYHVAVSQARGIGLGLAALTLLVLLTKPFRRRRDVWSPEKRIAQRHGCVIVDVLSLADADATDVPDFESIATLAGYCERPILCLTRDAVKIYAVEDGGRLYCCSVETKGVAEPAAETRPAPPPPPPRPPRRRRRLARAAAALFALAIAIGIVTSFTAANTVPLSYAGSSTEALQINQLAPARCSGINLTNLIVATSATTTGTAQNDLILGKSGSGTLTLTGGSGDDCIVGGGGSGTTNKFDGGSGTNDVCIGAPGATNTFKNCESTS